MVEIFISSFTFALVLAERVFTNRRGEIAVVVTSCAFVNIRADSSISAESGFAETVVASFRVDTNRVLIADGFHTLIDVHACPPVANVSTVTAADVASTLVKARCIRIALMSSLGTFVNVVTCCSISKVNFSISLVADAAVIADRIVARGSGKVTFGNVEAALVDVHTLIPPSHKAFVTFAIVSAKRVFTMRFGGARIFCGRVSKLDSGSYN